MNQHLWQRAASLACRAHEGQKRRNDSSGRPTPYVAHPLRVAITIAVVFGFDDEDIIAAALLHDTIEDTPLDYDDIARLFNGNVASFVSHMSKDMRLHEKQREALYDARLSEGPWQARLIKLADVYDNLSDAMQERPQHIPDYVRKGERAFALTDGDAHLASARQKLQSLIDKAEQAYRTAFPQQGEHSPTESRNVPATNVS